LRRQTGALLERFPILVYAIVATWVAMVVLAVGVAVVLSRADDNTKRIETGLLTTCKRVNYLRAQSNTSDYVQFRTLTSAVKRELALAKLGKDVDVHRLSAREFIKQAADLTVTPLTNCRRAVEHPRTYSLPVAGPIGNPRTGIIQLEVDRIIEQSRKLREDEGGLPER
jgi:hypothetical protein